MAPKKFSVVQFQKENSVDFVPSTWLNAEKTNCQYPNRKLLPPNFEELKKDPNSIPPKSWPKYKVVYIKSYDDITRAEDKVKRYLVSSDYEASESEGLEDLTSTSRSSTRDSVIVTPPETYLNGLTNLTTRTNGGGDLTSNCGEHTFVFHPQSDFYGSQLFDSTTALSNFTVLSTTDTSGGLGCENLSVNNATPNTCTYDQPNGLQTALPKDQNTELLLKILESQKVLEHQLSDIKTTQLQILSRIGTSTTNELTSAPPLPLTSVESLQNLEAWLDNSNNFNQLVQALSKLGGHEVTLCTYVILNYVFVHSFALTVRLTNTTGKTAIGTTRTANLVRESVRITFPNATNKIIDKHIGSWFRTSSDRRGGRVKRKLAADSKKNHKTPCTTSSSRSGEQTTSQQTTSTPEQQQ